MKAGCLLYSNYSLPAHCCDCFQACEASSLKVPCLTISLHAALHIKSTRQRLPAAVTQSGSSEIEPRTTVTHPGLIERAAVVVPKLKTDSSADDAGERSPERSLTSPRVPQLQASCMASHDNIAVQCSGEPETIFGRAADCAAGDSIPSIFSFEE